MPNFILPDKQNSQPSSKKLLFPAVGNYYRDLQPGKVQRRSERGVPNPDQYIYNTTPVPKAHGKS